MDFNDVGHYPDRAATEGCPSMKERKDTPDGHLFETEGSTFVGEVGWNELLTVASELAAGLPLFGGLVRNLNRK